MPMPRLVSLAMLIALITGIALFVQACGGDSPEEVATRVAHDWTSSNVSQVSSGLGELVTGDIPVLRELAGAAIRNQIDEHLTWTYSEPEQIDLVRYHITATASSQVSVNLLLVQDEYRLSADFVLVIDTAAELVEDWELNFGSFHAAKL